MAKNLGTFLFAANFQVKAAEALDPRMVAASKADLINKANWPSDGDTIYVYKGLIVDCGDDGVYRLIDPKLALDPSYAGWERIDAGGVQITNVYTYKGSVETYENLEAILNKSIGDVYNVEQEYVIDSELEGNKTYLAGTNWVWNGESWDALAGAIDLSAYATKVELSTAKTEINASISTNATAIESLGNSVGALEIEVTKKVNAVEGSSLIPSDKLELIDTNAADILALESLNLDARLTVIEGAFKDGENDIDLSDITSKITDHSTRITNLESNSATKEALQTLLDQVNIQEGQLVTITNVNSDQATQLINLTTRVETVEGYGASIASLTESVNKHTEDIDAINNSIKGLAVKSVKAGEQVLAADANGALSTTIKLGYDAENKKIQLKGISDAVVDELDATLFVKDGMLDSASYDTVNKQIVLTWNTDAGKESMTIPMDSLVDTYTAGSGLKVEMNQFSVVVNPAENNKLTIGDNGLLVDISSDMVAMGISVDNKIEEAFSWTVVE